ncbi:MAG: hypothetical protein EOO24_37215, partial [Comamonadaceae bacterium]
IRSGDHELAARMQAIQHVADLLGALDAGEAAQLGDMLERLHARGEFMVAAADLPKADRGRRGRGAVAG